MVVAYVLVTVSTGDAERLKAAMGGVEGVTNVDVVAGDVDFIVKVEADSPEAVRTVAVDHIHGVESVTGTQTYIAMD